MLGLYPAWIGLGEGPSGSIASPYIAKSPGVAIPCGVEVALSVGFASTALALDGTLSENPVPQTASGDATALSSQIYGGISLGHADSTANFATANLASVIYSFVGADAHNLGIEVLGSYAQCRVLPTEITLTILDDRGRRYGGLV